MPDLLRKVHRTRSSLPPIPPIGQDWNTALRVPWEKDHHSENRSIMDSVLSSIQAIVTHPLFQQAAWAVIIVIATRVVEKLTVKAATRMLHHGSNPLPSSSIIINIVRAIIWIVGASIVLDSCFGVNTSSVIAALGVGGIAVSLGFQDTLSNLIGGLQVTFMKIVKPGDNIEVGAESGIVRDVGWRHTTITNTRGETVVIPNSVISTTALVHLPPATQVVVPFAVVSDERPMDEIASEIFELARAAAEKVEGVEVTRVTGTTSFVADGTTYKFNSNVTFSSDVKKDSVLDLYLDTYGYVMKVDVSKASSDYAYVIDTGADEGRYNDEANYYAKVLLADGTQTEITVDEDCLTGSSFTAKKEALGQMKGDIVEYTKDSKDVYTLKSQADSATGKVEIKKGESAMTFGGTTKYANSKTIFLVQSGTGSKATYTTYTGYANVPSMSKDSGATYTVYCKSGDVATIVFVSGVSATSKDIVYVLSSKAASKVDDSDAGVYYEYKAVVNGEITTVKMDEKIATDGKSDVLYGSISYADKDNEILDTSACDPFSIDKTDDSYSMTGKVTAEAKDDIIGIDNKSYALSSDVELYAVTGGDKIETGALADVAKDGTVTVIVKNGEVITIFYGVSNDSPVGPGVSDSYSVSLAKNAKDSATLDLTVKSTNGSDTAKFTYKVFAYGITAGKDTAVEVSAGEGALVNGTSTVSVISGTNNTLVYYVVVTVGGDTLTTSTVIGG